MNANKPNHPILPLLRGVLPVDHSKLTGDVVAAKNGAERERCRN
jgi:hypothetical protein